MIIVVGGTGRLGQELVSLFKKDKVTVVSIARHKNEEADRNILCDLNNNDEILSAAADIEVTSEPLEAIINAAGFYHSAPLGDISSEEADNNFATHIKAPLLLISNLIERIKKDGADIVNVSSVAAVRPSTDAPAYDASKWALRGLSADLQKVLKDYPSRVISFCPAAFDPEDKKQMATGDVAKLIKRILDLPKNMEVSEAVLSHKHNR